MAWRVLEPKTGRSEEPAISISSTGRITWSKAIAATWPQQVARVQVLWDATGQRLGLLPANGEGQGLKVDRKTGRSVEAGLTLKAAGVFDRLELPIAMRPALRGEDGVWAISVRTDGVFARAKRRRRGEDDEEDGEP